MIKKADSNKVLILVGVVAGLSVGWIMGALISFSSGWSMLIGGLVGGLISGSDWRPKTVSAEDSTTKPAKSNEAPATLRLREEQLDIVKKMERLGKVNCYTEVVTEEKNITVPVSREELVIEKTVFTGETSNQTEPVAETIRIPLREEQVEIVKHPVALEEVSIYKRQYQTTEEVTETLKKEKLTIETAGEGKVSAGTKKNREK